MGKVDLDGAKKQGLTSIKKYCKHVGQVEIEQDWLNDLIFTLVTFIKDSHKVYNKKKIGKNMSVR